MEIQLRDFIKKLLFFEKKKNDAEHKHSVLKDKMEKLKLDHESRMAMMVKEEKFLSEKSDAAAKEYLKVFERNSYKEIKTKTENAEKAFQESKMGSKKLFDEHNEAAQALCDSINEEYGEGCGPTLETLVGIGSAWAHRDLILEIFNLIDCETYNNHIAHPDPPTYRLSYNYELTGTAPTSSCLKVDPG